MRRVAAIDIGSNSVRLVIYGVTGSALISFYDEKATCGLGQGLATTGKLDPRGRERALRELRRFSELAADSNLDALYPFATAAVRDASDGAAFIAAIAEQTGLSVRVISGLEEARYSALGVVSAIPGATGVVGDLGGGSLELVRLVDGRVDKQATLPIGALLRPANASPDETKAWIKSRLAEVDWLREACQGNFYLVGGAWRAFARAHIRHSGYPLSIIHEYAMTTDEAAELAELIGMMSDRSVALMNSVPRRRRSIMPYAALTLAQIVKFAQPRGVVASAHGLREGYVHHELGLGDNDPLLDYCRFAGPTTARIAPDGDAVRAWLSPLFEGLDAETNRWIAAACWMSDLAGRDHPDRRAEIALARGINIPSVAISHAGRAFLGTALKVRYSGRDRGAIGEGTLAGQLLTAEQVQLAARLGTVLRLAHAVSPSGHSLGLSRLSLVGDTISLNGPPGLLSGDTIDRRVQSVAKEFEKVAVLLGERAAA